MKLLVVNACVRGKDISRTWQLTNAFLGEWRRLHPHDVVEECDLMQLQPLYLNAQRLQERDALLAEGRLDAPMLALARQFAAADRIVVAAPFWDFSFPAIVKVYTENICVRGITFHYTDMGSEGLCHAEKLLYLTTRGGYYSHGDDAAMEMGALYFKTLCELYGIPEVACIAADGLDAMQQPAEELLAEAIERAVAVAKEF